MPVVQGQVFLQVALVFGLIGLLGLVLRWTFRRDTVQPPAPGSAPEERSGLSRALRRLGPRRRRPEPDASEVTPPSTPPRPDPPAASSATPSSAAPPPATTAPAAPASANATAAPGAASGAAGGSTDAGGPRNGKDAGRTDGKDAGRKDGKRRAQKDAGKADQPGGRDPATPGVGTAGSSGTPRDEPPSAASSPSRGPATAGPGPEDYGLLAVAAEAGSADEAGKVRRLLSAAGIRNTHAVAADGRHKVLVFGDELIRARRVAGGSQGAGGGATGSGGN
ncbi:MAG TPA: hypothetical protein VH561_15350 [Micromonosporaceae bacterium]